MNSWTFLLRKKYEKKTFTKGTVWTQGVFF